MFGGRYYHVLASYDPGEASRFGAGAFHLHELMRHAIESGCNVFDFTVGDERYKRDWSDTEAALFDHVSVAGWRGALVAPTLLAQIRVKRFIKQTPVVWDNFSKARAFLGKLRRRSASSTTSGDTSEPAAPK
jgi:CelD/BcsL family acetyltransferase involved in cellulose biosynthesis